VLEAYVEDDRSPREIIQLGFEPDLVRRVIEMVDRAEYKRRQSPPGIRVTHRGFGKDWRVPITNRYREPDGGP
jgi:NH3-dependent NAD+ synthetase